MKKKLCRVFPAAVCLAAPLAGADQTIDEIVIIGESQLVEHSVTLEGDALRVANTGDFLKWVPGANLNRNGPLTALPQYRGASGDRIAVMVDGMPMMAGGPNQMDAPLSTVPGANLKTLSVSRGIASVSAGQQTLGGHVSVTSQQGYFTDEQEFTSHLRVNSQYNSNGSGQHSSALGFVANDAHKLGAAYSVQDGDDSEVGGGETLPNSFFDRTRSSAFYGYQGENAGIHLDVNRIRTEQTGTASLPMDIGYIDSDGMHLEAYRMLGEWELSVGLGRQDIEHVMGNFTDRPAPRMPNGMPMLRETFAVGDHDHARLSLSGPMASGTLTVGSDYSLMAHDAYTRAPNNPDLFLHNFSNVENRIEGYFAEWVQTGDVLSWELGARLNRVSADADPVSVAGVSPMMAMNMMPLAMAFNQADREFDENNVDLVAKAAYALSTDLDLTLGLARKTRAPSYQELYLWAPLQATGGLADGRNYVGNLNLEGEEADEINLGLERRSDGLNLSFQVFYRKVDNFIQGTREINSLLLSQIQALSNSNNGFDALQFNNVDAELYGADLGYHGTFLDDRFYYQGTLSYVRGKREDQSDNLYRIAPLNHSLTVGGYFGDWDLSLTSEISAKQDKVSRFNDEQPTPGFGLLHFNARWEYSEQLQFVAGVDNLFDKEYQLHLNGYNRVSGADVAVGERLPGLGRNLRLGVSYQF
ncbi:TonB-dependent receptor domain-containing protein [Gilvimarinus sp. F26214L]|uniref:TonB-dependent receptor domain-containing protein n=1 Tax=Gilvimarinus sp. DZF01 TaxID=3461371 RepID=UPI004046351D